MVESRVLKLMNYVRESVSGSKSQDPGHDWNHIKRVYRNGLYIGRIEKANLKILGAALLLHDVVRPSVKGEKNHARASANFATGILPSCSYSDDEVNAITHCILMHSRSSKQDGKKSLEAKIVYDADKIDGLGEVGVDRALDLGEAREYNVQETAAWYLKRVRDVLKNEPVYTETAKRIVIEKLPYSLEFCRTVLGDKKYYETFYGK